MLESTIQPYEMLIRFNPDGTIRGVARRRLRVITEGGATISAEELPAEAVTLTPELAAGLQSLGLITDSTTT